MPDNSQSTEPLEDIDGDDHHEEEPEEGRASRTTHAETSHEDTPDDGQLPVVSGTCPIPPPSHRRSLYHQTPASFARLTQPRSEGPSQTKSSTAPSASPSGKGKGRALPAASMLSPTSLTRTSTKGALESAATPDHMAKNNIVPLKNDMKKIAGTLDRIERTQAADRRTFNNALLRLTDVVGARHMPPPPVFDDLVPAPLHDLEDRVERMGQAAEIREDEVSHELDTLERRLTSLEEDTRSVARATTNAASLLREAATEHDTLWDAITTLQHEMESVQRVFQSLLPAPARLSAASTTPAPIPPLPTPAPSRHRPRSPSPQLSDEDYAPLPSARTPSIPTPRAGRGGGRRLEQDPRHFRQIPQA
ncbi:hypothetical protein TRAPUB_1282 [Trametes pubescens]|uniref:Uncharacterized protein n=1 Tax=Trametes pubescens TaxID=154538 RepID=A0A1M2VJV0_TRAPU|nr:hypothetical protein TRAPUB_1282 [Trametes pubescens]